MSPATSFSRIWNVSPATLEELRREFDNAVGSVSRSVRDSVSSQIPLALWEGDDRLVIEFEVPGILQTDLDVQIEAGVLTVSAKRAVPQRAGKLKHNEHRYGSFQRRIRLDESLDPASVEAELENGLLTLSIARRIEAQPVRVAVRVKEQADSVSQSEPHSDAPITESDAAE